MASLLMFAVGWRELGRLRVLARRDALLVIASGAMLAAHFGTWIASLEYTSTTASVSLVCTTPMFAALLGGLLGDRVGSREWLGIAVAIAGTAVLAGGDWQAGGDAVLGDALALVGAVAAAVYLMIGRRLRAAVPLMPYLGVIHAIAAALLAAAALATGVDAAALPGHTFVACAGAAVIASLVGHGLLNAAVRVTPTHLVALAILGEPIGSSAITWLAFGETPELHAVIGSTIVLAGIAVGFARRAAAANDLEA
jgi:drug/metabolite transporter (DMT)-like permease